MAVSTQSRTSSFGSMKRSSACNITTMGTGGSALEFAAPAEGLGSGTPAAVEFIVTIICPKSRVRINLSSSWYELSWEESSHICDHGNSPKPLPDFESLACETSPYRQSCEGVMVFATFRKVLTRLGNCGCHQHSSRGMVRFGNPG